ncbi:hypothetical protein PCANB_001351 [Pneumocystis canis]|nr:hypothetical protein PCANB_001351 [Pneumocystis canis]
MEFSLEQLRSFEFMGYADATSKKEILGWYSCGFSNEVFSVISIGTFIPVLLEQLVRNSGVFSSDKVTPCMSHSISSMIFSSQIKKKKNLCVIYIPGIGWTNSYSFSLYVYSIASFVQNIVIISISCLADYGKNRKTLLLIFSMIGGLSTISFIFIDKQYLLASLLFILGSVCFSASTVLLNAFLPGLCRNHPLVLEEYQILNSYRQNVLDESISFDNVSKNDMNSRLYLHMQTCNSRISQLIMELSSSFSSKGIAIGYCGAIIFQIISILVVYILGSGIRSSQIIVSASGLWWLIFSIPVALWLRSRFLPLLPGEILGNYPFIGYVLYSWRSFIHTFLNVRKYKNIMIFLLIWFFISNAYSSISCTAVLFVKFSLYFSPIGLVVVSLLSTLFGIVGAFSWPYISRIFIPVYGILGFLDISIGLKHSIEIYLLAAFFGFLYGGLQGYARSYFGQLCPENYEARFYALYAITEKCSSFLGPAIIGYIVDFTHNMRYAFFFLFILLPLDNETVPHQMFMGDLEMNNNEGGWMDDVDLLDNELPDDDVTTIEPKENDDMNELASILKEGYVTSGQGDNDTERMSMQLLGMGWESLQPLNSGISEHSTIEQLSRDAILKQYFPGFEENKILKFSELFISKKAYLIPIKHKITRTCFPTWVGLDVEQDDLQTFGFYGRSIHPRCDDEVVYTLPFTERVNEKAKIDKDASDALHAAMSNEMNHDLHLICFDWYRKVFSDEFSPSKNVTLVRPNSKIKFIGEGFLSRFQIDDRIFNGDIELTPSVQLNFNDPFLLLDIQKVDPNYSKHITNDYSLLYNDLLRRYNISNDEIYDQLRQNQQARVRQTLGHLSIEHGLVADRLQSPYYKTRLSKTECRLFHRPVITFKINHEIKFDKIGSRKKKKDRIKDPKILLSTTKGVTLSDNSTYVLMEYSEEYPSVISNPGMGSKVVIFYRKKSDDDYTRPKMTIGETHILEPQDRSPFWNFGTVDPGETVLTLYNKMIRAPIFAHEPENTDFLVLRNTSSQGSRYYLRSIKYLYVIGQTLPVIDVPGPHSRKITMVSKNRLKMICFRLLRREESGKILIKQMAHHFPDQNEMQLRQRLKEFMDFQRKGNDQGCWRLKSSEVLPPEIVIRSMISPETVCLIESMQVGLQNLEDAGYGRAVEDENMDETCLSIDQQLVPWILTRNFINATQGKAMLKLHGEGDPTGCGQGFSFIRTSMKGGFKSLDEITDEKVDGDKSKTNHGYNIAKQSKAYEDEIAKIWRSQRIGLSMTGNPVIEDLEFEDSQKDFINDNKMDGGCDASTPRSMDLIENDDYLSINSQIGSNQANKVLRIQRLTRNSFGQLERKVEIVHNINVIRAYIRHRQLIDDQTTMMEKMGPTDDEEANRRRKKLLEEQLARLRHNRERRQARKAAKAAQKAETLVSYEISLPSSKKNVVGTSRRCGNCGQVGHMKTWRGCPMYGNLTEALRGYEEEKKTYGFHVLWVEEGSAAEKAGIESYYDFIYEVDGVGLTEDSGWLCSYFSNVMRPFCLAVWSLKNQDVRYVSLTPCKRFGLFLRWCSINVVQKAVWHVLNIVSGSPAEIAGLLAYDDYIIGTPKGHLHDENELQVLVEKFMMQPLELYVYNRHYGTTRLVILIPNRKWGGPGALGCGLGYGYLHRLPRMSQKDTKRNFIEMNTYTYDEACDERGIPLTETEKMFGEEVSLLNASMSHTTKSKSIQRHQNTRMSDDAILELIKEGEAKSEEIEHKEALFSLSKTHSDIN